ncbi:MAG TPA: HD domain-containing protein [Archaeoglobus veneficus]|nr:HD domain-containing protein [Archaeoglobus veneficus]
MVSHIGDHVERVVKLAIFIAEKENANVEIVKKAAELHDIARDKPNHAIVGARIAEKILKGQGYDEEFIKAVKHCIESHSFSSPIQPKTLEAKILSDADKIDAIGAVGIARAFLFSGENSRNIEETLNHFEEKLLKLKDNLYTKTAKLIAEGRHKFLLEFYNRLKMELKLEDLSLI